MDKSKQKSILLKPDGVVPAVRISNYASPMAGTQWGPRVILDIELILVISGRFGYEDDRGVNEKFLAGELCIIMPGVEHKFICDVSRRYGKPFYSCIHLDFLPDKSFLAGDYRLDPCPPPKTKLINFREVHELFRQMEIVYNSAGKYHDELVISTARSLWMHISRNWIPESGEMLSPIMQQMTAFLNARFMDSVGREDLARKFGVTPQYVNRLFQRELKQTPTEYLNQYRIMQAEGYLRHGDMKVSEVASLVGFDDPFYFSRVFKKYTGSSPSQYVK